MLVSLVGLAHFGIDEPGFLVAFFEFLLVLIDLGVFIDFGLGQNNEIF